jgi:hypothetical protein
MAGILVTSSGVPTREPRSSEPLNHALDHVANARATLAFYPARRDRERTAHDVAADRFTDAFLEPMRRAADPAADRVVKKLFESGETTAANDIFRQIVSTDEPIPARLPDAAIQYFDRTATLPRWADAEKIAVAQALFVRTGWQVAMGLFCSSLPQAYAAKNGPSFSCRHPA